MKARFAVVALAVIALCWLSPTLIAQEKPPEPNPFLKDRAGAWECTCKFGGMESKGTETNTLVGPWLISDFKGDFMGQSFQGHGIMGYDSARKKFVGVWVDSMSPSAMHMEGALDSTGKILTTVGEGPDEKGKLVKYKMKTEVKDKDTHVFTMSAPGPDGKDAEMMTITYKRKK